jgi:hypothetical protein
MNGVLEKRLNLARVLVMMVGTAWVVLLGLLGWVWCSHPARYYWLLGFYLLLLLAPWFYCCWRRCRWAWSQGWTRLPRGTGWRLYGGTLLVFITLLVFLYSVEYWRGKWAYARLMREVGSKGGSLDLAAVIPPPVPDDQNFCATPLLAALTDYVAPVYPIGADALQWRKPELIEHWKTFHMPNLKNTRHFASWPSARPLDLAQWQRYFAGKTNFSLAVASSDPASDVLEACRKFEPDLAELRVANQRPEARWAVHYQDGFFADRGERIANLRNLLKILNLHAVAALAASKSDVALQDVLLAWRLADSVRKEPSIYAHRSRLGGLMESLQPVWEGLVSHRWSENQLVALESRLNQFDLMADWRTSVRGGTYMMMELCRQVNDLWSWHSIRHHYREMDDSLMAVLLYRLFYPGGWLYQDLVYLYRFSDERLAAAKPLVDYTGDAHDEHYQVTFPVDPFLAVFVLPKLQEICRNDGFVQTQLALDETRVACALERYRLAQGEYPGTLTGLSPRFIERLPQTPDTQKLLLGYRRLSADRFLLFPANMQNVPETWSEDLSRDHDYVHYGDGDGVWRFP